MGEYPKRFKFKIDINKKVDYYVSQSKQYLYYYYRELFNKTDDLLLKCALLYFLNKTSFRGLYREGPNGFNVPFGNYKNPTIYNEEKFKELNKIFNKYDVQFDHNDYKYINEVINKDDFVYFDPPYYPLKKTSFTSYNKDSFHKEHDKLLDLCNDLDTKSINFVHSNSFCDYNNTSYSKYNLIKINCRRRINSKKPNDSNFELIIYN